VRAVSGAVRHRPLLWTVLVLAALSAVALVAVPVVLLYPFRPQTPSGVALAFQLRRIAPAATVAAAALALAAAVALARGLRRWQWVPLGLLLAAAAAAGWFARQNHFEWMFRPIVDPAYARAAEAAAFVGERDMLIAVEVAGEAVAYPVRQMAYHHLVNDVVGGEPVVSTY
jgi:hypothetical protein